MNIECRPTTASHGFRAGKRPLGAGCLAVIAACSIATAPQASPASKASTFVPRISGTWEIVGTPDANECGVNDPFSGLATISFDGILTTVDPISGRTALGEVFRLGQDEFGLGFFGTLSLAPNVLFDFEVQATLTLSDTESASGPFRTILSDPNGVLPDCVYEGTVVGERRFPMPF